jgi:inosine/xanthosine triphosphate pyrophosphatase family protein
MKYQTSSEFSATEKQFLEALRQHPELRARFQSILDLIRQAEGTVQTADAVEGQLIEVLRQLGHASMNQWAAQAEQRVSTELRQQDATVRSRKKKR